MKRTLPIVLAVAAVCWALPCPGQTESSPVRDHAQMFSHEAIQKANETLHAAQRASHWQIVIETIDSMEGKPPIEKAIADMKAMKLVGLYILISKSDHKLAVEPSDSARSAFPHDEALAIRDKLLADFKAKKFDDGLLDAVAEASKRATDHPNPKAPPASAPAPAAVVHHQVESKVIDHAQMFSTEAVQKADKTLQTIQNKSPWRVVIETVETLDGKTVREVAVAHAQESGIHGLYGLIAKKEHKFELLPSEKAQAVFPKPKIASLTASLTDAFKAKEFDRGLLDLATAIEKEATLSAPAPALATSPPALAPEPVKKAGPSAPADVPVQIHTPSIGFMEILVVLIVGGVGIAVFLWLLKTIFGGGRSQAPGQWQNPPPQGMQPGAGYPPRPQTPQQPGYAPPQPGGYGPQPGYGPPPGYGPQAGYGPPQQHGGGAGSFVTGALGGLGGAVVGNILYDKFGRPHPDPAQPMHPAPSGGLFPQAPTGTGGAAAPPPPETYDPNAGATGDWGAPDPTVDPNAGASGSWSDSGTNADAGASGDWGTPDPAPDAGAQGDWGAPEPEPEPDTGAQGDWGGSDNSAPSGGDDQGGSW